MKEVWYHISMYDKEKNKAVAFGISAKDKRVVKANNDYKWMEGLMLIEIKPFLLKNEASVIEVK